MLPDLSQKSEDNLTIVSDTFKMTLKPNKEYPLDKFIRDLYFKREDMEYFFSIATLFNRFTLEGERKFKSQSIEDKAISDLLKNLGYVLSESKKNKEKENNVDLEFRVKNTTTNHTVDYEILGVNFFSHNRERASIVFIDLSSSSSDAYLLVKGVDRSMNGILNMNDRDKNILRELSANFKSAGLKQLIYGIRKMETEELINYRNSYDEILKSTRDQKEAFELLAQDIEKDLKYIGCFGIRDTICPEGLAFSNLVRSIGIKFSILSGDSKDNCLNVARVLELTKSGNEENGLTFNITSDNEEEISGNMKRILDQIYEDIKRLNQEEMKEATADAENNESSSQAFHEELKLIKDKLFSSINDTENDWQEEDKENLEFDFDPMAFKNLTKRTLILYGPAINIIGAKPLLLTQMRTILLFCSSIVGYSMQPGHKAAIVKLIRGQNDIVLAVGDGFNDIRMIREANIGVQLSNAEVPVAFSDMIVGSIEKLSQIMFINACNFNLNLMQAIVTLTWISFSQLAFYYLLFYLASLYSEPYFPIIKFERLVICVLLSVICITDSMYSPGLMENFPILYKEQTKIKKNLKLILIFTLVLTTIEALFVICCFQFFLQYTMKSDGKAYGTKLFENFLVLVSTANSCFKVWLCRKTNTIIINLILILIPASMVPFLLLLDDKSDVYEHSPFWTIGSDYSVLASLLICILIPCSINWLAYLYTKIHYTTFLCGRLNRMNNLIENHPDRKSSKKIDIFELRKFLFENLKDFYEVLIKGRYQVTSIIKTILTVNGGSENVKIQAINKIVSTDLFNYQLGLKHFTNYISEKVDRRKFRAFLSSLMRKYASTQLVVYLVCYVFALIVGLSYTIFRGNYMMDTTIPYMIVNLTLLFYINRSKAYHSKQYSWTIGIGIISCINTLLFSALSNNSFELNMIDIYNIRFWFNITLETIESTIFVAIHLSIRIFW